jgi:hypothetical protein
VDTEGARQSFDSTLADALALLAEVDEVLAVMDEAGLSDSDEYTNLEFQAAALLKASEAESPSPLDEGSVSDKTAANNEARDWLNGNAENLRAKINGVQKAIDKAKDAIEVFEMSDEKAVYDAAVSAAKETIKGAEDTLAASDGQVTDPATRDALASALETLKDQSTKEPYVVSAGWYTAQAQRVADAVEATLLAIDAVNGSRAAWQEAQGVPVTPPVSQGSRKPSKGGGSSGGSGGSTGGSGGGSGGGGWTPPPPAPPAPGIVTWTACDGRSQWEMVDGTKTGNGRGCAIASQVQAELVNTNQTETCAWYSSMTADSKGTLLSAARAYPSAKFVATQVDDRYVKMDIYTCLKE